MTVRLMSRDPSNPTSYTVDTGYPFDSSTYIASSVGSYSYQLKMLFDQSDNVESIIYVNAVKPGYYDNSGGWHTLSSINGTINVLELNDFDYSKGIYFGNSINASYTTSQPATTPIPKIGSSDISKIYLGSEEISKIYLGSELVYEAEADPTPTNIGDAYYVSSGTEVANNTLLNEQVLLLKQPPYNSGLINDWDSTKPFKISVKNVIVNNHSSVSYIISTRLASGVAEIYIDTSGYFKYFCNYGSPSINSNIIALTNGDAYDLEIEYDGINSLVGRAKLSSSDTWYSQVYSYTITSTPTDYTAIRIGATNATINIDDAYVENNNTIRFQR